MSTSQHFSSRLSPPLPGSFQQPPAQPSIKGQGASALGTPPKLAKAPGCLTLSNPLSLSLKNVLRSATPAPTAVATTKHRTNSAFEPATLCVSLDSQPQGFSSQKGEGTCHIEGQHWALSRQDQCLWVRSFGD